VPIYTFATAEWRRLRRSGLAEVLLDVAERDGVGAVIAFMHSLV
jgi:hypothetical protein